MYHKTYKGSDDRTGSEVEEDGKENQCDEDEY